MSGFLASAWWLLVSIGVLVTFHEYGHFVVARWFGVHVLRFSIGFGKPLFKRIGRDGTEFVVAAIPLGGYVKMLDEREFEVAPVDRHRAHNNKPVLQRMAIAAAGPAFNFLLCFVLLWAMFMIGKPDYLPIVGRADALAAQAGFEPGDRLLDIGGEPVSTWTDADLLLGVAAMNQSQVRVEVARSDGGHAIRDLDLRGLKVRLDQGDVLDGIGLVRKQWMTLPIVSQVAPDGPVGALRAGDRILAVDGKTVADMTQLNEKVRAIARADQPLRLTILRDGKILQADVVPRMRSSGGAQASRLTIGIAIQQQAPPFDGTKRYGPLQAMAASATEMRRDIAATWGLVQGMFVQGTTAGLSGPIGIARAAGLSAEQGVGWFLFFLAVLSLNLGLINLLPVPILDGGHLLYYLMELVKGRPVSERTLAIGQYIGLAMLGGLMCLAFYNDLLRPPY